MLVKELIQKYYQAFNDEDDQALLGLLHPEVIHDINQGGQEIGKEKFRLFLKHMRQCYREAVEDIHIFSDETTGRGSAEFYVSGAYIKTDPPLPPSIGQTYHLRVGAFFECKQGKIHRVTTYYNLKEWLEIINKHAKHFSEIS